MAIKHTPPLWRDNSSVIKTPAIAEYEAQIQDRIRVAMQKPKKPTWGIDTTPKKSTPPQW